MWKQAYIIHSYLHLRPVAKWTLTIWSGKNTKVSLIWMKRCISSWSYYLKYMQDINQEGMEHFRQLSHECNQYPFHEAVSFKFNRPINMCSSMFADLSTKANSEWSVKKTRSLSLDGDLGPNDLELLNRIYLAAFFLPSCNLPLNLINKDEFLSIMKFTLNHKFFQWPPWKVKQ